MAMLLYNMRSINSDGFDRYFNRLTGNSSIVNHGTEKSAEKDYDSMIEVSDPVCLKSNFTSQVFLHQLAAMNIGVKHYAEPHAYLNTVDE
jgi:hypothetical protein